MSNNLNLDQVVASQNQKETTINDANGQIDAALTVSADYAIDNTNARTLTNAELQRVYMIVLIDDASAPTGAVTITLPAVSRGIFMVKNDITTHTATIEIAAQPVTSPTVATGVISMLHSDGINVRFIA